MSEPKEPDSSTVDGNSGRFRKGRAKTGGRCKGTPNRATRAIKESLSEVLDDPEVQDAIKQRILGGDTTAFFKAVEMVHGKPRQSVELDPGPITIKWKGEDMVRRLEEGRKRVAAAREPQGDD